MRDPLIVFSSVSLLGCLSFAQVVIAVLGRAKPHLDLSEIRVRTRSWWIMLGVLELALYFGKATTIGLIGCLSFFALREFLSQIPTRVSDRRVLFWVFLAIPIQFYLIYQEWLMAFLCFIPLYGTSVIAVRMLFNGQPKGFVLALSHFQLALLTSVYSISHIAYMPLVSKLPDGGITAGALLFFICIGQANDIFQFIAGKLFGKHKIMPLISPKKTTEGFLGGVIISAIVSTAVGPLLTPLAPWESALAGVLLSIFGFFGDVLLSAIKRDLEIKDFSQIIPGHGGMLDRIDSLVISAPLYFHLIRLFANGVH